MKLKQLFESSELIALYGWFHEAIEDNNIDLVDEFEDGKILIYDDGKVVHSMDLEAAQRMKRALSSPENSYEYTKDVIKGEFKLGEPMIATNLIYSFTYAESVIKGRFKQAEKIFAKDIGHATSYAIDVIKGRFELGEPAIAQSAASSFKYAKFLNKRFELGEPNMKRLGTDRYWLKNMKTF